MSQVLQKLRDVDPSDNDAVKEVITAYFQNLLKHTEVNSNIWLRVLEDVITRFPRFCSQHRSTIENYLVNFLDSSNYYNVIAVAKCAHGLQQIRPSQDKIATPKNCWREQMNILCNTAHTLIEAIFSKTVNIYKNKKNIKIKDAKLLVNTPLTLALSRILNVKKSQGSSGEDKKMVLCYKLRNIFVFIQAMLLEVYPVAKPIQPQLILEVIVQALSVSSSVNTDVSEASTVKVEALRTLNALILCLGPNLIPFSGLVFRFVMQTLRWSTENPSEESRKVRVAAYYSLTKWLSMLHVHRVSSDSRGRSWEDELTKHIIEDITPVRKIVQLTMSTQHMKNLSKKARRKLTNTMLQQSTIASHMPGEKNKTDMSEESSDEVANAALECAETFLTVSGIFLKSTTHKMFQERLVRECYNLETYTAERSLNLLRALDATRKNTPTSVPPPTQYCVHLYSTLVNSQSDEIRKFCSQALLDIRLHLHCSPPSLNFTLEAQVDKKRDKSKRREISEKNRAALESLLGEDRMPPEKVEDVSNDEPSSKRPRLDKDEEIEARISISSGTEDSVVISDDSDDEVQEIVEENTEKLVERDTLPETEKNSESNSKISANEPAAVDYVEIEIGVDKEMSVDNAETEEDSSQTDCADKVISVGNSETEEDSQTDSNVPNEADNIFEAKTQIPLNISTDTIGGDKSPASMEIAYDIPNTSTKVTLIDKMDDENLPSTNDTDDVQITCGQQVSSSQEIEPTKDNIEMELQISTVKSNGMEDIIVLENGGRNEPENDEAKKTSENIEVKITSKEVTVEDMLADFVDEVNEEPSLVS